MIPFKIGYCINYTKSQRDVMLVEVIESLTNKLRRSLFVVFQLLLPTLCPAGAKIQGDVFLCLIKIHQRLFRIMNQQLNIHWQLLRA
jgi:hypothetical protein